MSAPSDNPQNPQNPNPNQNQPGLFGAHAEYIKGAAEVCLSCPSPKPSLQISYPFSLPTHTPFCPSLPPHIRNPQAPTKETRIPTAKHQKKH